MTNKFTLSDPSAFHEVRYYIYSGIIFLNIGILFGGLNALRLAGIVNSTQIHKIHWTSTLFGAMTILMMGLLLYLISLNIEFNKTSRRISVIILGLLIAAVISNYIQALVPGNFFGRFFEELIKLGSVTYLIHILIITLRSERKFTIAEQPAFIMIYAAILWMGVSQLIFLGYIGIIGPTFLVTYVYGFFSLTLFGSLNFILPGLYSTKPRSKFTIYRDTIMISLSAFCLLLNELLDESYEILGLLGTIFWGLVGFMFLLYIFDLIFKTGGSNTLVGLSIALIMFGFFVFDTLMNAIFPIWVSASHAHFMFLGTLVITIISISLQLIDTESDSIFHTKRVQNLLLGIAVILVGLILFGFTLQLFQISGYAGIVFFLVLVSTEIGLILSSISSQ